MPDILSKMKIFNFSQIVAGHLVIWHLTKMHIWYILNQMFVAPPQFTG